MIETTAGYNCGKQFAQEVKATILAHEMSLDEPQEFALYLYLPTQALALDCQTQIQREGYDCEVEESAADDDEWLCYITTPSILPTSSALETLGTLVIGLASSKNGNFDGWEIKQDYIFDDDNQMDFTEVAENILNSVQANFVAEHQFEIAELKSFEHIDPDFYAKFQSGFTDLGFKPLADLENLTSSALGTKTVIRTLYHPESNYIAIAYFFPAQNVGIFEIETLLSNGMVVVSTIAPEGIDIIDWPLIDTVHVGSNAHFSVLHLLHLTRCAEILRAHPKVTSVPVRTFSEFIQMQNHMNQHKHECLKKVGWITKEYLLAQTNGDEYVANGVYEAIQNIINVKAAVS